MTTPKKSEKKYTPASPILLTKEAKDKVESDYSGRNSQLSTADIARCLCQKVAGADGWMDW